MPRKAEEGGDAPASSTDENDVEVPGDFGDDSNIIDLLGYEIYSTAKFITFVEDLLQTQLDVGSFHISRISTVNSIFGLGRPSPQDGSRGLPNSGGEVN